MFTIARTRHPLADLRVASNQLNRLFDEALRWPSFDPTDTPLATGWLPPVDVVEDQNTLRLVAELPGVKPEDVKISLENNVLTISGEKAAPAVSQDGERAHRFERSYGAFERSFTIPNTVDAGRIEARYELGTLTVTLPKAEQARPRQISIKVQA